ncbi:MAG: DbpA RNA binding domain-containing protein, partial [Deltaproteobacteria bacterium]|nr:DbpA RNA binding domain-containing protein [Deltaproteobacteria bacterium]
PPRAKVKPGWAPDAGGGEAPVTRRPPPPRRDGPTEGGVWFRINVGQRQRADPKWLVPMLCRRGGIDKADIGRFNILANETRVLIRGSVAEAFLDAASLPDRQDPRVKIVPA